MTFGDRLKFARKENNLTQAAVAEHLGIAEGSYCAYEKNTREPNVEKIRQLANLYNVSADFLINTNKYKKDAVLNEIEKKLLNIFKEVNTRGQEKIIDYAEDISSSEKYKKYDYTKEEQSS